LTAQTPNTNTLPLTQLKALVAVFDVIAAPDLLVPFKAPELFRPDGFGVAG
jgi:hypothetical protein